MSNVWRHSKCAASKYEQHSERDAWEPGHPETLRLAALGSVWPGEASPHSVDVPVRGRALRNFGAFTAIELMVSLLIVALLVALLFPALNGVLLRARMGGCVANMKHIGQSFMLFAADHQGRLSSHNAGDLEGPWTKMTMDYGGGSPVGNRADLGGPYSDLRCPQGRRLPNPDNQPAWDTNGFQSLRYTYVYNHEWYTKSSSWPTLAPPPLSVLKKPASVILLYSSWHKGFTGFQPVTTPDTFAAGRPVLFADGHLEVRPEWVAGIPTTNTQLGVVNPDY